MVNETIGNNIRNLRKNAGYGQGNLAQLLGVDQSLISKIENGERGLTSDMMSKLAALFGVTEEQLENPGMEMSSLSVAFRGGDLSVAEMEAISAINRIALNSEWMSSLLKGAES